MANDTKTRGRKPAEKKTPATNAAGDVIDDGRELAFFTIGAEADRLPPIQDPRGTFANSIGALADVAYFSGYFPGETPAQLAIKILTGIYLDAEPIAALFDLIIQPGGRVAWKANRRADDPAELAADDQRLIGSVIEFRRPIDAGPEKPGNANKGPLLETEPKRPLDGPQPNQSDSSQESGDKAAESAAIDGDDLGFPTDPEETAEIADALSEFARTGDPIGTIIEPTSPFESKAETVDEEFDRVTQPDPPATTPGTASRAPGDEPPPINPETLAGIEVGATIATWRNSLDRWLRELEFATDVIVVKLAKFDQATTTEKKTMFDQCSALYSQRLAVKRSDVLIALGRDGKTSLEQMAGAFAYYEVPDNPETWSYADALKAFRIIERETPNLLIDPPKDKAKK